MSWDSPNWKKARQEYHASRTSTNAADIDRHTDRLLEGWAPPPLHSINKARKTNGHARPEKLDALTKMQLGFPDMAENGKIRNTCNNIRYAIKRMEIACGYDEFHDRLIIGGQVIGQYAGELSDHACLVLRQMIEVEYEFDPGPQKMFDACVQLCLEGRFNPVLQYLSDLQWDGTERIDK
jgi:predicted P-loop ATPase